MGDEEAFYIPRHVDDPERWLFWTWDEALALILPIALISVGMGQFLLGIASAAVWFYGLRRLKGSEQPNIVIYMAYWFFPHWLLRFKGTPPSYIREYVA